MAVDFEFSGRVIGADVTEVMVVDMGCMLHVSKIDDKEIIANLNSGKWAISLADNLNGCADAEIEIFDFDKSS